MQSPGTAVEASIVLHGEFDYARREELHALLRPAEGAHSITLDLRDVAYVDASTLGCFVRLRNALASVGSVRITGARPQVARMVYITGLDAVFGLDAATVAHPPAVPSAPKLPRGSVRQRDLHQEQSK